MSARWEYEWHYAVPIGVLKERMNQMAADGWEVMETHPGDSIHYDVFYRRPRQQEGTSAEACG